MVQTMATERGREVRFLSASALSVSCDPGGFGRSASISLDDTKELSYIFILFFSEESHDQSLHLSTLP